MRSLVPCGSLREPRAFSEARLHSSRREDNYPHFAGPLFNARSPLSRTAAVVTTATSPIVTIKPATVRGPRRREAPGMPRGARVLRSQPGLWGGGRGSGPACAPPGRGRECLTCPRQAGTWPASLVLFSMGRVGYCGAMCHGGAHPARGFRHGLLAPFAGDLEGGRSNVTTFSCWHSVLVSVTARSRGGCCSSRPHGTFGERPGGDCTGRSFSCDQQRAGFPSAPPWALWGVALLHPPVRPASQPGVLPSCPSQLLP